VLNEKELDEMVEKLCEGKDVRRQIGILSLAVMIKVRMGWLVIKHIPDRRSGRH
jgi:hypothetical protein